MSWTLQKVHPTHYCLSLQRKVDISLTVSFRTDKVPFFLLLGGSCIAVVKSSLLVMSRDKITYILDLFNWSVSHFVVQQLAGVEVNLSDDFYLWY